MQDLTLNLLTPQAEHPDEEAMRAGADAWIAKPYHYADLLDLARALLARPRDGKVVP